MADDLIKRLAIEQRKRLVASILGAAENSGWWAKMTRPEQLAFRDKVLTSTGTYHDFMLDVIKVGSEDSVVNTHALALLERVHQDVRAIARG